MVILAIVAGGCLVMGAWAAAQWLPSLADGPVGGLSFLVVCGLCGAALAILGVHIDLIARAGSRGEGFSGDLHTRLVGDELVALLWQAGGTVALALVAYLLAPKAEQAAAPAGA